MASQHLERIGRISQ